MNKHPACCPQIDTSPKPIGKNKATSVKPDITKANPCFIDTSPKLIARRKSEISKEKKIETPSTQSKSVYQPLECRSNTQSKSVQPTSKNEKPPQTPPSNPEELKVKKPEVIPDNLCRTKTDFKLKEKSPEVPPTPPKPEVKPPPKLKLPSKPETVSKSLDWRPPPTKSGSPSSEKSLTKLESTKLLKPRMGLGILPKFIFFGVKCAVVGCLLVSTADVWGTPDDTKRFFKDLEKTTKDYYQKFTK